MITEHISFYPHKEYDTKRETTGNLKSKYYVQYGYIKRRDLDKWLNNEVVPVKMGMLTPSNKCYHNLTILDSALKRIKEQDTTALFDDEDELIPIYIFVSEETDNEWREYLISQGFKVSRKNANREGIKIKKSDIGLHYGKHYGYDTEEVLSEKEEEEKKRKERQLQYEEHIKTRYEKNKKYFEETLGYGKDTYDKFRAKQEQKLLKLNKKGQFTLDEKTLEIKGYEYQTSEEISTDNIFAFIGGLSLCIVFLFLWCCIGGCGILTILSAIVAVLMLFTNREIVTKKIPVHIDAKGNDIDKEKIKTPYISIIICLILSIGTILGVCLA
jgi:hypothetical protein